MASIFLFKGQEDRKMSFRSDWKQLTFKDKMDILEAFFTIVVSIIALWGTFTAIENGFFSKMKHLVDHYHEQIVQEEVELASMKKNLL